MGLGGMMCALKGANVVFTDQKEVLPLLQGNIDRNLSPGVLKGMGWDVKSVGQICVKELDWLRPEQRQEFQEMQIDVIVCADCVYNESLVEYLLETVLDICGSKTTVVVVNEDRSDAVRERFEELFERHFTIKKVPHSKMDVVYQHPNIDIFVLKRRKNDCKDSENGVRGIMQTQQSSSQDK
eukprot:TRINITY_DN22863_c0_g1_i1.p3 TRINITY_DN22863_c0_g1~~TRINITY_DN22863_c0_g1_i1.p3  ORF type:complete len:203 (-),score=39.41 TRINITY_DN22863_c0_g1_i1:98-643(-)